MKIVAIALFILLVSGCSKDALDGPIPDCPEILSQERQAYVEEGKKRCDQARTIEERMKSVGCVVREKFMRCERLKNLSSGKSSFDNMNSK